MALEPMKIAPTTTITEARVSRFLLASGTLGSSMRRWGPLPDSMLNALFTSIVSGIVNAMKNKMQPMMQHVTPTAINPLGSREALAGLAAGFRASSCSRNPSGSSIPKS